MLRQLAFALTLGALALVVTSTPPAEAGRRGDALAASAKSIRKGYKQDTKAAEKTFNTAVANIQKGLSQGPTSAEQAATGFGQALAFYAAELKSIGDGASDAFASEIVNKMGAAGDENLAGGVSGDGGSADKFAESIRTDLSRLRAKARKRALKFAKAMANDGGARVRMRVTFEAWPFSQRPAANASRVFTKRGEPVRLWGTVATRLTDGNVIFTVFGSAAATLDNEFDVRLEGPLVRPLGDLLSEGGMDVSNGGTWSWTGTVGNAFVDGVDPGNRQIHFGMDPEDGGIGGDQPGRLEHAGLISIP